MRLKSPLRTPADSLKPVHAAPRKAKPAAKAPVTMPSVAARLSDPAHTLYLIDISSFIFRAYYAIRPLTTQSGEPVNAVYGVATMMARLADEARPENLAVVYDSKEPSFRKEIFPEYKANRTAPPDDLIPQFGRIEELIRCLEMHSYRKSGVEADDLIATLTRKWCKMSEKNRVVVVSSDKDLMQLVNEQVSIWDTMNNKMYGSVEVEEKFGVKPTQIRDYLALVGDSSDNIPGVPSIGPKTAADLLKEHGNLDAILKAAADGKISGKKGETLVKHEEDARLSAELATVHEELEVEPSADHVKYRFHVTEACADLLRSLSFHSLLNRWHLENKTHDSAPHPAESGQEPPHAGASGSGGAESHDSSIAASYEEDMPYGTLAAEIPHEAPKSTQLDPSAFRTVNTREAFEAMLAEIEKKKEFGFDVETTSLNPRQAELVGIAICTDPSHAYYIPVGHRGTSVEQLPLEDVIAGLRAFLEDPRYKKIGQNLKYDWSVMAEMGIQADGIGADTMVAAYVLDPEGRHNLDTLASHYLGYKVMTYEEVCGKGKDQIGFDLVPIDQATRYSAEDALIALRLWNELRPRLEKEGLMDIFAQIDLPLVQVLSEMEREGVCIDVEYLKKLSHDFSEDLKKIEERIGAYTQGPINLNSTKQLGQLLFDQLKLPVQSKTKTGYSTDASVLAALAPLHEVPRLLLEYREITKLKGTYVDPLPLLRDPKTGKIHASFHQTVAATGRLSSSDPNLQNIPIRTERGQKIRGAFIPSPGNILIAADYSQIELRLLAHMSGDPELVRAFREGEDVHRRTASEIFGVMPDLVDDRQRSIAKAINFGLMYGKTAFGLSQELKISRREAADTIQAYFERYSAVKRFLDQQILDAKERGYVETLLGRKRYLPDIRASNAAIRANAERMAMNTPIQGTAADLMKIAMLEIADALKKGGYRARVIIQVHDEVVIDCPEAEAAEVEKLVCRTMEKAGQGGVGPLARMKLDVPLQVNSGRGKTWMEI